MQPPISIQPATFPADIETVRLLLREYADHLNSSSEVEHICLDSYEQELATLPGVYSTPRGALLIARLGSEPAGCVAMKPLVSDLLQENACEMKRLWVRPQFRGLGLGTTLTKHLVRYAVAQNYDALYLDTLPAAMQAANQIYRRLGFKPVERYRDRLTFSATTKGSPVEVAFFRLSLTP